MAKTPSIVSTTLIDQASGGNAGLRALLQQLTTAANTQATKTSTSGRGAPNQSTATVTFQNPLYIVTFLDPGGSSAASLAQAAQQAASASLGSNPVQSVIYHQLQAATSLMFDSPSGLETYGGDSGSLQTQFTIGDLSTSSSWFFRFRTSFDGVVWNQWKILSGRATSVNANSILTEPIAGGKFAGIVLPGSQIVGFGVGLLGSGQSIQTAQGVLLANTLGIVGPAGVVAIGRPTVGLTVCSINSLGVTTLTYDDDAGHNWTGSLNFLTFGWNVKGAQGLSETVLADGGRWVILTVSGGAQVAIGTGVTAPGTSFDLPAGFTSGNCMGVATPAVVIPAGHAANGISQSNVVANLPTVTYNDGDGHSWTSSAHWFAVAWQAALVPSVVGVAGGQYLIIPTPGGPLAIGVGQTPSGGFLPLPPGYSYPKCLCFTTPGTYDNISQFMEGVDVCSADVGLLASLGTIYCLYTNGSQRWTGAANWFSIAWL